jgi:hypothetical protein
MKRLWLATTLGALLLAAPAHASSGVTFSDQANYALSGSNYGFTTAPTAMAAGDVNGDGIPDLTFVSEGSTSILSFHGKGDGTFSAATKTLPSSSSDPQSLAIGTFHGHSDAAIGVESPVGVIGGFWQGSGVTGLGGRPYALATGDFNEDGLTDLAMPDPSNSDLQIALQTSGGWSTTRPGSSDANVVAAPSGSYGGLPLNPVTLGLRGHAAPRAANTSCTNLGVPSSHAVTAPGPTNISVADIDRDGHLDLYVSADYGSGGTSDWIAYGDGNGCFPRAETAPGKSRYALVGDVTGDGKPELLASQYSCTSYSDSPPNTCNTGIQTFKTIYASDGNQTYDTPYITAYANSVDYPQQWQLADFNGDGHPDIFAAGYRHVDIGTSGFGSVILNEYSAASWGYWSKDYQIMSDSSHADGPIGAAVADFNQDGYPDAATLNLDSKTVSVMLNETAANAVVGSNVATSSDDTVQAVGAKRRPAAAVLGDRALSVSVTCRRGVATRACAGVLTVRRPGSDALVGRLAYRLKPGVHTLRVPARARLRHALRGAANVLISTRTRQDGGAHAAHSTRTLSLSR